MCERGFNRREKNKFVQPDEKRKKTKKSVRSASQEKKRKKQLQTRGEKDKGVSLSLCVSVFHDLIIFTLAVMLFLVRTVKVSQVSVLFVCRFRAPFFSQVV